MGFQDEPAPADEAAPNPPTLADARDKFLRGEYEQAAEIYAALGNEPGKEIDGAIGLALCRREVGEYTQAIAALTAVEDHAKDSAGWHVALSQLHRDLGAYDDALHRARQGVEISPKNPAAHRALAELLEYLGRRDEAIEVYRWFDKRLVEGGELERDPAWLTDMAVGFVRYSVLTRTNVVDRTKHALHQMLQSAYERIDRTYLPARLAAADLLRERFNNQEEDGSIGDYLAALKINPKSPAAHVGIGAVALESWNFEETEQRADRALTVNPRYAPALHLLARKYVLERRYPQAAETCAKALAIDANDLVALSIAAAAAACRYDQPRVDELAARVAAINPRCATFHRTVADALSGIRQYQASEKEYLVAIELDPTDANARTELGMMYMQWGPEDKARDALDAAWTLDRFNQRTKFTLDLLDSLQKFAHHDSEHFVVRYDAAQDPGLGEYLVDRLEEIYDLVTADFETPLDHKTVIEFFPTHRAFGVRITGKPWIHTVGACTGWTIALATPRESAQLMDRYNLARVLKHEFTHTVTLAATHNRIPHWYTEGLAVHQEDAPRSFDWMVLLADAVRQDRLFTLESLDWGFMRPKRPTDRTLAYAQSEWMCEYLIERFGYGVVQDMLRLYREGKTQPQVLAERLQTDSQTLHQDFRGWARKQVEQWGFDLSPPEDVAELRRQAESQSASADVLGRLALAELDEPDYERALDAARRALSSDPNSSNALKAIILSLGALLTEKVPDAARRQIEDQMVDAAKRLLPLDPASWTAPKALAEIMLRRREWAQAEEPLLRLQRLCARDPFSFRGLAGIYLDRGEEDKALPQLLELARIEQNDADVPGKLADVVRRKGNLKEAAYWYRQALLIDPFSIPFHQSLGEVLMQLDDFRGALREYRMLTRIQPRTATHFEAAAIAANRLGDKALTEQYARRALEINPQSSVRTLLGP